MKGKTPMCIIWGEESNEQVWSAKGKGININNAQKCQNETYHQVYLKYKTSTF